MNRYLLDTHTALWWWTDLPKLGPDGRAAIADSAAMIFVSAVTAFEIGLKWHRGKLPNLGDPRANYLPLMQRNGFSELAVTAVHAMRAGTLDGIHRDPFDRIIAAQALSDDMTVITRDAALASLGCKVLW